MRIALMAPVWERVPPRRYGGIEIVVSLLADGLAARGHEVTLFASGDSITKARLESVFPTARRVEMGAIVTDLHHASAAFLEADRFDVIHNHDGYSGVTLSAFVDTPVLTTLHGIFTEGNRQFFAQFADACWYNSLSDAQAKEGPKLKYVGTIYNGIDVARYRSRAKKEDFFVTIGRVSPLKGTHVACEIARKAGVRLIIAGKIDAGRDTLYFEEKVEPLLDDEQVVYVGEVSEGEKRRLFGCAKGFLFPLQWSEPFGLVLLESMACGTPVLSLPRGSVPEVVVDGETGFIAKSADALVDLVGRVGEIDPARCRAHVEAHFTVDRMVDDYEAAYTRILGKRRRGL